MENENCLIKNYYGKKNISYKDTIKKFDYYR